MDRLRNQERENENDGRQQTHTGSPTGPRGKRSNYRFKQENIRLKKSLNNVITRRGRLSGTYLDASMSRFVSGNSQNGQLKYACKKFKQLKKSTFSKIF